MGDYDAYLFDIDGTLLNCVDAVHYFAFCSVLSSWTGRATNLDGVTAHGNTDMGILRDALALAGFAEDSWRPRAAEMRIALCRYVAEHEHELRANRIDGVEEMLGSLRSRGAVLGIVTGNLEQIGRLKLKHSGLLERFDFGSYSDECEGREEVVARGLQEVRRRCGPHAAVCMVGDTPADIRAARANGLNVIAVATGIYSREKLAIEQPSLCVTSLRELLPETARADGGSARR